MTEHDRFELDLRTALRAYASGVSSTLNGVALARTIAAAEPRRRTFGAVGLGWPRFAVARIAWVLLLVALALAAALAVGVGIRPPPEIPAVVPGIPAVHACPAGSSPDEPGALEQARPPIGDIRVAVDRASGQLIAIVPVEPAKAVGTAEGWETWAFDLCTNAWTRMSTDPQVPSRTPVSYELTYDWRLDLIVMVGQSQSATYSFDADRWTSQAGITPVDEFFDRLIYDPVAGEVLMLRSTAPDWATGLPQLWRYDVSSDAWTAAPQSGAGPATVDGDHTLVAYDTATEQVVGFNANTAHTWLLDTATGAWVDLHTAPPALSTGFFAFGGEVAYDEAADRVMFVADGEVATYDAKANRWEIVFSSPRDPDWGAIGPQARGEHRLAYDPTNGRLVMVGGAYRTIDGWRRADDVWAFETTTATWTQLLAPSRVESGE